MPVKTQITILAESFEKTKEQTEKIWIKLRGNGSEPYNRKSLRRYCAGLRLLNWLQEKLKAL